MSDINKNILQICLLHEVSFSDSSFPAKTTSVPFTHNNVWQAGGTVEGEQLRLTS
jgi:hypothetical protein